jgi:Tol biopolymer transport system component
VQPGTRIGSYEVIGLLGAGGMGEVYRARDSKLNRQVALKILPAAFAADPERLARFNREAQVLASLNHANIATIHGVEHADASSGPGHALVHALVLELVEGPTLAERIAGRPMPLDEALSIARQVAEALATAHEQSVVHRDLKPANVKVRADGSVKVLDFGLAKALDSAPGAVDASRSPTLGNGSARGVILGTAAYMSPEQARGQVVDERADIWAFGCVLFEMLTGRQAFPGDSVSDSIASVLTREPDWNALPAATPSRLRRLLRRCLEKNPRERLHDMQDVRLEIADALQSESGGAGRASEPRRFAPWRLAVAILAAGLLGAALMAAVSLISDEPALGVTRLSIGLSGPQALVVGGLDRDFALSPDGMRLVYIGANGSQLFVRRMDSLDAAPLGGLAAPRGLFISPDGAWVGFFDGVGTLRKIAVAGGPAVTLCQACGTGPRGSTWGPNDTIVMATTDPTSGLLRLAAGGGDPEVLTKPDLAKGEREHFWPEFLPGGQAVLFTIVSNGGIDTAQIVVLDLQSGMQKVLIRGGSHAHYVPSGHLVYAVRSSLHAIAFDSDRLEVIGTPTPIVQDVATTADGGANFGVAVNGTLVYVPSSGAALARTLTWVDRSGREEAIRAPARSYTYPRLSPDGARLAVGIRDQDQDIWIWDFARETLTRFTFDLGADWVPAWTPDGRRLIFDSARAGAQNLFWQAADGAGPVERLTESQFNQFPSSVAPDGKRVVFRSNARTQDIAILTLDQDRRVESLIETPSSELNGEISPDGKWLAYESNESGRSEIYVRPFPDVSTGRWQVSSGGGTRALWGRNGQELFYLTPTGTLMSVRPEAGITWTAGPPAKLFEGPYYAGGGGAAGRTYDVAPDGRFLMIKPASMPDQIAATVIVVQNWFEELRRLVPVN